MFIVEFGDGSRFLSKSEFYPYLSFVHTSTKTQAIALPWANLHFDTIQNQKLSYVGKDRIQLESPELERLTSELL